MAAKKPQTVERDFVQQSIRFQPQHLKWLTERADSISASLNAVVRQLVDDARAFYCLSPTMVEALEKDRVRRGLDYRGYIQDLLTQRYRELLRTEFEAELGTDRKKRDR
jgi:hypothetical protein